MKIKQAILMLLILPFTACAQPKVDSNAYDVMLKSLLDHTVNEIAVANLCNSNTNYIYLDARAKEEYDVSHIKNAIWVGYDDFDLSRTNQLDKSSPIIVYCSVGYRSEKVAEKLNADGFSNVSNLYGGIFEWKNQEHSVVNNQEMVTDSVHAYNPTWGIWLNDGIKVYK